MLILCIGVPPFFLVIYSTQVLPGLKQIPPNYFEEYTTGRDIQLPMGPTLSKGAVEEFHLVILIYIPCILLLFLCLVPLIVGLWVAILESTSMLPSVIQYLISRFFRPVERRALLCPLPFPMAVLIQTPKPPKAILWAR